MYMPIRANTHKKQYTAQVLTVSSMMSVSSYVDCNFFRVLNHTTSKCAICMEETLPSYHSAKPCMKHR